jgi:hypothetical protein
MPDLSTEAAGRGSIAANIPCLRCGYNLRGLDPQGRCPECGDAVGPSVEAHRAITPGALPLDAAWARRTRAGAILLLVSGLLSQLQNEDVEALVRMIGRGEDGSGYHDWFDLTVYVLAAAGLFLLTGSTAVPRRGRCLAYAWIARVGVAAGVFVVIAPVLAGNRIKSYGPWFLGRMFLTLLASTSLYAYLGTLFRHGGRRGLSRVAFLLAGLFPLHNLLPILAFEFETLAEQFDLGILAFVTTVPGIGPRRVAGLFVINLLRYPGYMPSAPDAAQLSGLAAAITTLLVFLLMASLAASPIGRRGLAPPA